jgi:hypothetical protein
MRPNCSVIDLTLLPPILYIKILTFIPNVTPFSYKPAIVSLLRIERDNIVADERIVSATKRKYIADFIFNFSLSIQAAAQLGEWEIDIEISEEKQVEIQQKLSIVAELVDDGTPAVRLLENRGIHNKQIPLPILRGVLEEEHSELSSIRLNTTNAAEGIIEVSLLINNSEDNTTERHWDALFDDATNFNLDIGHKMRDRPTFAEREAERRRVYGDGLGI